MQTPHPPSADSEPATKADLRVLKSDMHDLNAEVKSDMHDLKSEVKSDMRDLKSEVKSDVRDLKSDMDSRLIRTEEQLNKLQVEVAHISGQMPYMATAESVAKVQGEVVALRGEMKAGFADIRALFAERLVPLEEFKRKTESRYRYAAGVAGALVIGFAVTAWKVFIGA